MALDIVAAGSRSRLARAAPCLFAIVISASPSSMASDRNFLKIGVTQPIDSLNPFVASSDYSLVAYQYAYPFLTTYDRGFGIIPSFATDWNTADGKMWTFHTVTKAHWSDGAPLTARDAAFTLNMIARFRDGPTARLAGWVGHLVRAEAPDARTLVLVYDRPVGHVPDLLQAVPILPDHVWSPLLTQGGEKIASFENAAPWVSGGPFMLTRYKPDAYAIFARNVNWWGAKAPFIDGFGLQFFANDDAMVVALMDGQLDMIGEQTPPTVFAALLKAGIATSSRPGSGYKTLVINSTPGERGHPELLEHDVREALERAIDRAEIVRTAWLGHATIGSTVVAPATGWHDEQVVPLAYDPARANEILDRLGYGRGDDGVRVARGHRMSYEVVFSTEESGTGDRTFQIIKSGFAKIGIRLSLRKMDPDAALDAILGANGTYGAFDLAMSSWVPPLDPEFVLSVLTCAQRGTLNEPGYCNSVYDGLYQDQVSAPTRSQRQAIVDRMQEIVASDRPCIVLVYPDVMEAHLQGWTGFVPSPLIGSLNNLSADTLLSVHHE